MDFNMVWSRNLLGITTSHDINVNTKMKISDIMPEAKIRFNRGVSWMGIIKNAFIMATTFMLIFKISVFWAVISVILVTFGYWCIGYIDLRYTNWMKREQELLATDYNPQLKKIDKLDKILNKK